MTLQLNQFSDKLLWRFKPFRQIFWKKRPEFIRKTSFKTSWRCRTVFPCRNTLIYAHSTSRTLPTWDMCPGSQTVATPQAGDFVGSLESHVQSLLQKRQRGSSATFWKFRLKKTLKNRIEAWSEKTEGKGNNGLRLTAYIIRFINYKTGAHSTSATASEMSWVQCLIRRL
jgi:hypothetical protein